MMALLRQRARGRRDRNIGAQASLTAWLIDPHVTKDVHTVGVGSLSRPGRRRRGNKKLLKLIDPC